MVEQGSHHEEEIANAQPAEQHTAAPVEQHRGGFLNRLAAKFGATHPGREIGNVPSELPTPPSPIVETPSVPATLSETMQSPVTQPLSPEHESPEPTHEIQTDPGINGRHRHYTSLNHGEEITIAPAQESPIVLDNEASNPYNTENPMGKESYNPQHESTFADKLKTTARVAAVAGTLYSGGAGAVHAEQDTQPFVQTPTEHITSNPFPRADEGVTYPTPEDFQNDRELESASEFFPITNPQMLRTWERTDKPVADGIVNRTWMWGPGARTSAMEESYDEAPGGKRIVQYFDKSRMEITHPEGDQNSPWYVTNGLLAKDLITGKMQVGDNRFEDKGSAHINVAGDPGDDGVTYASFNNEAVLGKVEQKSPEDIETRVIHPDGSITTDESLGQYGVSYKDFRPETGHNIAAPFYDFMNSTGPVLENGEVHDDAIFETFTYATGLPISEAYWTDVMVGGQPQRVLVQAFERRVLTFNPNNPEGWQVEAGNVGQHYYKWEYGHDFPNPNETDESCDVEKPFPEKIGNLDANHFVVENDGCDVGVVITDDPNNNIDFLTKVIEKYAPGDKFEFHFTDDIAKVPDDPRGADNIPYSQNGSLGPDFGNAPTKVAMFQNPETGVWEFFMAFSADIPEDKKILLNQILTDAAMKFIVQKGDVLKNWGPDYGKNVVGPHIQDLPSDQEFTFQAVFSSQS